jgi:2-amino-4-hydroxy-6-hydroxymethyldihydropteridine diphosphokinase
MVGDSGPLDSVAVAIALGSNLGDRRGHIVWAAERLTEVLADARVSSITETAPVDVPDEQPPYLNAAIVGETSMAARQLMDWLLSLERERGRVRPAMRAARTLDLDLILYGAHVIHEPALIVPHPRFRDRAFVLEPLAEIAPEWIDPVTGMSIRELTQRYGTDAEVPR